MGSVFCYLLRQGEAPGFLAPKTLLLALFAFLRAWCWLTLPLVRNFLLDIGARFSISKNNLLIALGLTLGQISFIGSPQDLL